MKIIRPRDVAIKTTSDFDWDRFVDTFDWDGLYEDAHGNTMDGEEWGIPVLRGGYRLVSLNLPLTSEDMKAIRAKFGNLFVSLESVHPVFKLIGNMLFVVNDVYGFCLSIVRFEPTESGYVAVEFLEDTEERNLGEPVFEAAWIAMWLSDLLPSPRFDILDRSDWDKGFCWKEEGDPDHEPNTKFFRNGDIAVLSKSEVDWDGLLDSIDWDALHRICASHYFSEGSSESGHRVTKDRYRLVALDLVLTRDDMQRIRSVCDNCCSPENYSSTVFQMFEHLLVVVADRGGLSRTTIIRFEETDAGWRAVEFVEDAIKVEVAAPLLAAAAIAQLLNGLANGRSRFEWINKDDPDQGWYWRDAGNFLEVVA